MTPSTQSPLHIVLVEPEIPPNTGNIGRLCVAAGARLHLVKPLGFQLDDRALARAGLDYWPHLDWRIWDSWADLQASATVVAVEDGAPPPRFFFFTTKTSRPYWDASFTGGDYLVFGRETRGLPESLLTAHPDHCLTIPMAPEARSLNLATAAGIALYEAVRQINRPNNPKSLAMPAGAGISPVSHRGIEQPGSSSGS
jgi:tRNA (cytidine/uridine-2'-O-)-methyltransferase